MATVRTFSKFVSQPIRSVFPVFDFFARRSWSDGLAYYVFLATEVLIGGKGEVMVLSVEEG